MKLLKSELVGFDEVKEARRLELGGERMPSQRLSAAAYIGRAGGCDHV